MQRSCRAQASRRGDVRRVWRERVVSRRAYDTRARPDSYGPTDAFENSAQMSPRLVVSPRAFSGLPGLRALRRRPPGRVAARGRHVETRGHTGRLSPSCLGCGSVSPGSGAPSPSGPTALGHKRTVSPAVSPSQEARGPSLNRPAGPPALQGADARGKLRLTRRFPLRPGQRAFAS